MSNYYCLDIEFVNVDFSSYYVKSKTEISKTHHAHLYANKDEIELRIFYDDRTYFGERLMDWSSKTDWSKFGLFLKVALTKNQKNRRLQKVDLSEAKLLGSSCNSDYYENGERYVIVRIDTVKLYWNPVESEKHTAEFYLDDKGFRVVEPFY